MRDPNPPKFPKLREFVANPAPKRKSSQFWGEMLMGETRMEHNPPYRRPKAVPPKDE